MIAGERQRPRATRNLYWRSRHLLPLVADTATAVRPHRVAPAAARETEAAAIVLKRATAACLGEPAR